MADPFTEIPYPRWLIASVGDWERRVRSAWPAQEHSANARHWDDEPGNHKGRESKNGN